MLTKKLLLIITFLLILPITLATSLEINTPIVKAGEKLIFTVTPDKQGLLREYYIYFGSEFKRKGNLPYSENIGYTEEIVAYEIPLDWQPGIYSLFVYANSLNDYIKGYFEVAEEEIICTDSDVTDEFPDGKNYYVKGTTCLGDECSTDFCSVAGGTVGYVNEYFCEDNQVSFGVYDCPGKCEGGVCVEEIAEVIQADEPTTKGIEPTTKEFTAEGESSIIINWDILLESTVEARYGISRIISDYPSDIYPTSFANRKEIASLVIEAVSKFKTTEYVDEAYDFSIDQKKFLIYFFDDEPIGNALPQSEKENIIAFNYKALPIEGLLLSVTFHEFCHIYDVVQGLLPGTLENQINLKKIRDENSEENWKEAIREYIKSDKFKQLRDIMRGEVGPSEFRCYGLELKYLETLESKDWSNIESANFYNINDLLIRSYTDYYYDTKAYYQRYSFAYSPKSLSFDEWKLCYGDDAYCDQTCENNDLEILSFSEEWECLDNAKWMFSIYDYEIIEKDWKLCWNTIGIEEYTCETSCGSFSIELGSFSEESDCNFQVSEAQSWWIQPQEEPGGGCIGDKLYDAEGIFVEDCSKKEPKLSCQKEAYPTLGLFENPDTLFLGDDVYIHYYGCELSEITNAYFCGKLQGVLKEECEHYCDSMSEGFMCTCKSEGEGCEHTHCSGGFLGIGETCESDQCCDDYLCSGGFLGIGETCKDNRCEGTNANCEYDESTGSCTNCETIPPVDLGCDILGNVKGKFYKCKNGVCVKRSISLRVEDCPYGCDGGKCRKPACGVESYINKRSSACPVSAYKLCRASAHGVSLYTKCRRSSHGTKTCFGLFDCSNCGRTKILWTFICDTCTYSCGYKAKRTSACPVALYKLDRTSACPVLLYSKCRASAHGVEKYKAC